MQKSYLTLLLSVGVALASLTSCSRTNYAFNSTTPAYLGQERVHASVAVAAPEAAVSTESVSPVRVANTTVAQTAPSAHRAARHYATPVAAAPVAARAAATKAERHEFKQALRQLAHQKKAASPSSTSAEGKSQIVAAVLAFFLGFLGIHRFYLGYTVIGIIELLTFGLFGILSFIDFIRILLGNLKPKDGDYTTKF